MRMYVSADVMSGNMWMGTSLDLHVTMLFIG